MNIVVVKQNISIAETYAKSLISRKVSLSQITATKLAMFGQLKGFINQMQGRGITAPVKRRWTFKDGFGGMWAFDFTFYHHQQLAIITSISQIPMKKPVKFTPSSTNTRNVSNGYQSPSDVLAEPEQDAEDDNSTDQQNENRSNVIRLTEADLRYIISETTSRIISDILPDIRIDDYDVILGREWKQILDDCQEMGPVEDICLFSPSQKIEGTFALYRRLKNNKYFFTEWIPNPKTGKTTAKLVQIKNVPPILLQAAKGILSN